MSLWLCAASLFADPRNLATNGVATGSSEGLGSVFADGNDGNRDGGLLSGGSVFHTLVPDVNPFWEVNLGAMYYLDHVRVFPRTDELEGTVANFRLRVFDATGATVFSQDFLPDNAANFAWGTTMLRGTRGQRVRLERFNASPAALAFAELEVWGQTAPLATNLARGKPVTASAAGFSTTPERGNDGEIDGDYFHPGNPLYHSAGAGIGQFWQVDLQSTNEVGRLVFFHRTDYLNTTLVRLSVLNGALAPVYVATQDVSSAARELGAARYGLTIALPAGVVGQHVRLDTLLGEYLSFAEVEVYGPSQPDLPPGTFFTATNATWRMFKGRAEASSPNPAAWRLPGFDDAAWSNAPAPFLYTTAASEPPFWSGGAFSGTLVNDMISTYSCLFLRKSFAVSNATQILQLHLTAVSDDGFIAWINGVEVARRNMPEGSVAFNGIALAPVTEPQPEVIYAITNASALLLNGVNVLAVQAFNSSFGSSDFGFMAGLRAVADEAPPLLDTLTPAAGELLAALTQIEVAFTEPVSNVDSADLQINGAAAAGMVALDAARYRFTFPQPPNGAVSMAWRAAHGIRDAAGNAFAGGSWSYTLDTALPPPRVLITEFLADNNGGLRDEDNDSPDWIELFNPGPTRVDLGGWFLTDATNNLTKWRIPATNLAANAYLVVFASNKDRTNANPWLHTNFKLDADGGYLALVRPDGATISSEFRYGRQRENVSFGVGRAVAATPLLAAGVPARVLVPANGSLGGTWTGGNEPFNDTAWIHGPTGVGFDQSTGSGGLLGYWTFNDASDPAHTADASGNNHQGTLAGGAAFTANAGGRTGQPGDRAVNFGPVENGASVTVADAALGMFDTATTHDAITLSLWVFGDNSEPGNNSVFYGGSNADGTGARSFNAHLPWSDSVIYWDTGCCDPTLHRVSVGEPDSTKWKGRWNHYVFLKNGSVKQIWQNGARLLEGLNTARLETIRGFAIGAGYQLNQWSYGGLIDDFAVWDVALTSVQIQALASGASPLAVRRFTPLVGTDVGAAMRGVNASAFVRVPFIVEDPATLDLLTLRMRYDDGFVAYLNGAEVARRNAPSTLAFNASATVERPAGAALSVEEIDLSLYVRLLRTGANVLAFHGLNFSASDAEFLVLPELSTGQSLVNRFFATPTPRSANDTGIAGFVADTHFTTNRGFFPAPFDVGVWVPTPGATLVYTTDGSEPALNNGVVVAATNVVIRITNTTVLRAAAFKPDFRPSDADTHTYLFVTNVASQARPPGVGPTWPGGAPADFEIDARIVNTALPGYSFTNALLSIPTLSIVTPPDALFGANGIYANPGGRGDAWERAASVELIYPDGRPGFQENAGLAIHGNISRDKGFTPKHSFNALFRGRYGATKLDFPLFTNSTVQKFDRLVLRAGSTDTWPCTEWSSLVDGVPRWVRAEASGVRDQWVRDAQLDLGHPSGHGTYAQLYLNGIYWGLYNVCERPDDDFAASYLGGGQDEYDVLADFAELRAGNPDAWNQMNNLAGAGLSTDAAYQRLLGNNADGTRNTNYPVYLDVTNLVDYMILHVFIGADDWPNHNWWAARRRGPESTGFKFFAWDQEISISSLVRQHSSWGPIYAEADVGGTPTFVYARCRGNAEFRLMFADRVQRHLFNGGALSRSNNVARWDARVAEVDRALVAESARWGDYQRPAQPYRREVEIVASNQWMHAIFWPSNHFVALKRFRDAGLFPLINAPIFRQHGGSVPDGYSLSVTNPNAVGTIYFTTDGSDPRLRGGGLTPGALVYAAPLTLTAPTQVRARVKDGATWSALSEAPFYTPQDLSKLQLNEIYYNPPGATNVDGDEFEFLEFKNTGAVTLNLSALSFTGGLSFTFSNGATLGPGQFFVLVRNPAVVASRFPGAPMHGLYSGRLDNAGETLTLTHPLGGALFSLRYNNHAPWPEAADGLGPSLQRVNTRADYTNATNWTAAPPTPGADVPTEYVDTDSDGMPDTWELAYNLNPNVNDAGGDLDGDGLTNGQEFIAGTNPRDATSALRVAAIMLTPDGAAAVLTFNAAANRGYSVQWRASLGSGAWQRLLDVPPLPAARSVQVTNLLTGSAARFFRLVSPAQP